MRKYTLEVCIDSTESAMQAVKGGADRLEMCSNLIIGGTTPDSALFEMVRKLHDVEINVLIRPRYGDFLYTEDEFERICSTVKLFRNMGADGIVVGCLLPDGSLDRKRVKILRELAGEMNITLHRAFDMCKNPMETLKQAIELGVQTILTSGQKQNCVEGMPLLKELVQCAAGHLDILVGGGINAGNIHRLADETKAYCFHMSGKVILDSSMVYRKTDVSMGIPGISEYEMFRTDEHEIRKVKSILEELS